MAHVGPFVLACLQNREPNPSGRLYVEAIDGEHKERAHERLKALHVHVCRILYVYLYIHIY